VDVTSVLLQLAHHRKAILTQVPLASLCEGCGRRYFVKSDVAFNTVVDIALRECEAIKPCTILSVLIVYSFERA